MLPPKHAARSSHSTSRGATHYVHSQKGIVHVDITIHNALPVKFLTSGSQQSPSCICSPGHDSRTTSPRSSSRFNPIQSPVYKGCRRMGMISRSGCTPGKSTCCVESEASYSADPSGGSSAGMASDPNHALSFGTTVLSSAKRTRTSLFRVARLRAYVALRSCGRSLLIEARKRLALRYVPYLCGSRKY